MKGRSFLAGAVIVFVIACGALPCARPAAAGVQWSDLKLEEALAEASRSGKMLLIDTYSGHCGACSDLDEQVWNTQEGEGLAEGMIAIRIDTTGPDAGALQSRFPVTGLPSVIFVRPDGVEVDRVAGYHGKQPFFDSAVPLRDGVDRLAGMEEGLAAHADSLPLLYSVLERRLNRGLDAQADSLLQRVIDLDPFNTQRYVERSLTLLSRYFTHARKDPGRSEGYWRMVLDRFPAATTAGAAAWETYNFAAAAGRVEEWKSWICGILEKQGTNGRLLQSVAHMAHRSRLRDRCLAAASRRARELGFGGAEMESMAVALEKGLAGSAPESGSKKQ